MLSTLYTITPVPAPRSRGGPGMLSALYAMRRRRRPDREETPAC